MPTDIPPRGTVFEYPYRWAREVAEGASPDGRKVRTVCLVLAVAVSAKRHVLYLLAISSKPPRDGQVAVAVPDIERRRAGLTRSPAAWVYVSEFNRDIVEESFYFEPNARRLGMFSPAFVLLISRSLAARIEAGDARAVERNA